MFMPHLLLRYAGMLFRCVSVVLGQPAAGTLLMGDARSSVPVRVDVPLVMNRRRGSWDLSRRGAKVAVMI